MTKKNKAKRVFDPFYGETYERFRDRYVEQQLARRKKGKLYKVYIAGANRAAQTLTMVKADIKKTGTFARTIGSSKNDFHARTFVYEGRVVIYLSALNKEEAKVLIGEKIYAVSKVDLSSKPITSEADLTTI